MGEVKITGDMPFSKDFEIWFQGKKVTIVKNLNVVVNKNILSNPNDFEEGDKFLMLQLQQSGLLDGIYLED